MQRHALDAEVFIRSMATRGQLGGLSRSTADVVRVLDAWGAGVILVETVGVGQDELEVARLAHSTLVVMAPGMGDEVQAIKAGILEIADLFVVNKSDREGADATVRDLEMMIGMSHELFHAGSHGFGHRGATLDREAERRVAPDEWFTPVVKTVASRGEGVAELVAAIAKHREWLGATRAGEERRAARARDELRLVFRDLLVDDAMSRVGAELDEAATRVLAKEFDPYRAARELLARYRERP
jgi:LAO/AO transport system kinase